MTSIGRIFSARNLVIGTALLFLVVFVLFPLVLLVLRSFLGTEGEISLQNYIAVYGKESNWDAISREPEKVKERFDKTVLR